MLPKGIKYGVIDLDGMVLKICDTKEECLEWVKQNNVKYRNILWGNEKSFKRLLSFPDKGWRYTEKGWIRNE